MAKFFQNQTNGHREEVNGLSVLWAILFGVIYFAVKGLWRHVAIQVGIMVLCFLAFGAPGTMFVLFMMIVYAFFAPSILAAHYLRQGWTEVSEYTPKGQAGKPIGPILREDERLCPFCAEMIKAAAIKCRHCGSVVPPVEIKTVVEETAAWGDKRAVEKVLAPDDMACVNCTKHIPKNAISCPWCGHGYV